MLLIRMKNGIDNGVFKMTYGYKTAFCLFAIIALVVIFYFFRNGFDLVLLITSIISTVFVFWGASSNDSPDV